MGSQGERRGRDWRGAGGIRFRCRTGGGSSGCGGDPWGGKSGVGLGEEDEVKRAGREQATHTHPSGPWKYARSQILQLWTCLFRQTPSQSPRPHGAASRDQISKDPNGNPRVLSSDTPRTLFFGLSTLLYPLSTSFPTPRRASASHSKTPQTNPPPKTPSRHPPSSAAQSPATQTPADAGSLPRPPRLTSPARSATAVSVPRPPITPVCVHSPAAACAAATPSSASQTIGAASPRSPRSRSPAGAAHSSPKAV